MASFMAVEQPSTLLKNQAWLSVWVVLGDEGDDCGVDGGGRVYDGYLVVRVGRHQVGRGVQQLLHHSLYLVK